MKKIVVLYASGESDAIAEENLNEDDISLAEYLLIPTEDKNRSYVCIKPHKYLCFTKAYIQYTLCAIYYNEDLAIFEVEPLNQVTVKTDSICDLYGLLNSVDRLTLVNRLLNDVWWEDREPLSPVYGVCDFSVTLFEENTTVYHKEYHRTGSTTIPFDAYSVTKHFKQIYHPFIITDLFMNESYIGLIHGKHSKWEYGCRTNKYSLIGIACATTNTIIFITKNEYGILNSISGITIDAMIFYTTVDQDELLSNEIENGSCIYIDDVYEFLEESFAENTINCTGCKICNSGPTLLEIIANISFITDSVVLFMEALYPMNHDTSSKPHMYDCVLRVNFTKDKKSCIMNRSTILTISDILTLYSLKEED